MPTVYKLPGGAIQANTITTSQLQTTVVTQIQAGGGPKVKSLIYPSNDTAANTTGGQTVYLTGSGFAANAQVLVNGSAVPSQSFISASNISFTTPALSTGTYPVYLINPEDGGTAILYPGLLISGEPTWVTSAGSLSGSQDESSAWSFSLSTTGDTPITYALAAGNTLPSGITLAANGLISGTISSPTGNVTTYTFSVVATDAQNQDSTRQFSVTTSTGEGVLFANNVLLIHADGTNNQNNHAFLDSSNNNLTITRYGNATQGSFSPFSQTGWSNYFDGNGDYLTLPSSAALTPGTGDYTFEAWIYGLNFGATSNTFFGASGTTNAILFSINNGTSILVNKAGTGPSNGVAGATQNYTFSTHRWYHVAFTRQSQNTRIFVNGTQVGSTTIDPTDYAQTAATIGSSGGGQPWSGYISNLRFIKGTALYTSNFTPSTTPLTAVANTQLLTCQSNRFVDNSTNAFTLTRNGDVSVQAFSPFAPSIAYSAASVGGSVYFDGTGDWLSFPDNAAFDIGLSNEPFTIEMWYYPLSLGDATLIGRGGGFAGWNGTDGWQYSLFPYSTSTSFYFQYWSGSGRVDMSGSTPSSYGMNRWNHIAIVYNGSTTGLFINGTRVTTSSTGYGKPSSSTITYIGRSVVSGETAYINGYISGARIIKGSALYDPTISTCAIPTAPPTNVANTSLLLNFTNAGIFDQTAKNILETVGDAKVSTAQYKYGTGSIAFDGTGDYLKMPSINLLQLGSADFTVEFWFRLNSINSAGTDSNTPCLFTMGWSWGVYGPLLILQSNSALVVYASTDGVSWAIAAVVTGTLSSNTWYHFAMVRSGSSVKYYLDGVASATVSSLSGSLMTTSTPATIGASSGGNGSINGYIDDFRITKGYARYTSNFTPPSSAFKDK